MSPDATPPGSARRQVRRYRQRMQAGPPQEMLGLMLVVATALVVLVYAFLRMAGVIGRNGRRHGRPPPPSLLG